MIVALLFCGTANAADTIVYQDIIDEVTNNTKATQYDINLNAPFSKDKSGINETVNPENGQLSVAYNLFTLKQYGNGTLDVTLTYSTASSAKMSPSVEYNTNKAKYDNVTVEKEPFEQAIEAVGTGWRLSFPYVEKEGARNKSVVYVHTVDGSVYRYDKKADSGLEEYTLKDMKFELCEEEINDTDISYRLSYKSGDVYLFDSDGYLYQKEDIYGNITRYIWSDEDIPKLTSISDTSNNTVTFTYTDSIVKVTCNDRTYEIWREDSNGAKLVKGIKDPLGRWTEFDYEEKALLFDFNIDSVQEEENTYCLLKKITYPTGLETHYQYTTSIKWLYEKEEGYTEYAKILRRYEIEGGYTVNDKQYSYYLEPDGYPNYKSDELPDDYEYLTTETSADGSDISFFYDKNHNQTKTIITSGGKKRGEEIREYDKILNMPQKFTVNTYNESGEYRSVHTETVYDDLGNITRTSTYTPFFDNGKDVREYKYSEDGNICTYESYMKDDATKVEIERTVAPGGIGIASETVKENGRKIKRDEYTYFDNGNLLESRVQTGFDDYLITRYTYAPLYSGKFPTEVTISGVRNADGAIDTYITKYAYDSFGNVTSQTDPNGNTLSYTYDKLGRVLTETLEDGKTRTYSYNDRDNTLATTDANNKKLLYSYDRYGKIKSVKDGADVLLKREYDNEKRIISETATSGAVTKYTYDTLSRVVSAVTYDTDGSILNEQYLKYDDAFLCTDGVYRLKLTVTEGNAVENRTVSYIFDRNENAIEQRLISNEGDRIYSFSFDNAGNNTLSVSPSGAETKAEYDIFGNLTYILSPDGLEQHFEYDFAGNIIREINGEGGEITRDFDSLSRVVSEETTNGVEPIVAKSYYDYRGNVTKQIDPKGNKTEYEYDQRGFLTAVRQYSTGSDGLITEYEYDGEGNVTKYAYGGIGTTERHTYQNVLDSYGRPIKTIDSIGNTELFEYDLSGNILKQTDEKGIITQYTYNGLGNLLTQTNSQEGTITYQYNSFGEPISIADNDETKEITYSNFGEVIKEVTGLQTNSYQYDEDGNLIRHTITDKDLEDYVTEYSYNKSGLVTAITTGMGTETITYDKAGRIKEKFNDVTGFSKSYSYYKDNSIRDIKTRMDGDLVYSENFGYDKNGNKIYEDQNGDIRKYTYDGLNRLTGAEIGNVRTEYEFDNYNNISREYEIIGGRVEKKSYYYDNANRLLLEDSANRTVQYEYDNSGNLIKKITGIGSNAETSYYRYDGYNRLSEFIDDYSTAEYSYNINGLRESKTVNGVKTRYIYNGADIIGEIFDDNIYTYYRATELIGYTNNKGDRYYYRQNSHGDVTALLTVDGQEKKTYSYNAYGKETPLTLSPMGSQTVVQLWRAETEQIHNPFRYCGEYQDAETGLIYLRNRYYDNSIGRFISKDTHWNINNMIYGDKEYNEGEKKTPYLDAILQANNLYVYVLNNPITFSDPTGELRFPGEIHNVVLKRIVSENSNLSKERWINLPGVGLGRVDLVDTKNGKIWELKPESWSRTSAEKQLKKYTTGTFMAKAIKDLSPKIGDSVGYDLSGSFDWDIYKVEYKYTYNGIITYSYSLNKEELIRQLEETGEAAKEGLGKALQFALMAIAVAAVTCGLPVPAYQ